MSLRILMVAAVLIGAAAGVSADTVMIGKLAYADATITAVTDGELCFTVREREIRKPLTDVTAIRVDAQPAITAAEDAFAAQRWSEATDAYLAALRGDATDWVKHWSAYRLAEAAEKAGRIDAAVAAYLHLRMTASPLAARSVPKMAAGAEAGALSSAAGQLNTALAQPSVDAAARRDLLSLLLEVQRARGDQAAAAQVAEQLQRIGGAGNATTGSSRTAAEVSLSLAHAALSAQEYQKAIDTIESGRRDFVSPLQQADALYCLAEARYGLARQSGSAAALSEAALAYMRVVAHFHEAADVTQVPQSLHMSGVILEQLRKPAEAAEVYRQVVREYPNSPAAAEARQKLAHLEADGAKP